MCEFSGKLIAWLDHELPDAEATNVEWHVGQCAECRKDVSAYREISAAFLDCYEAAMVRQPLKRRPWIPAMVVAAAAATILLAIVFWPRRAEQITIPRPAIAPAPATAFILPAQPIPIPIPQKRSTPAQQTWVAQEPSIRVILPADALFPPGAVPEGFSFIADVRPEP
jgi:hypothetical protein